MVITTLLVSLFSPVLLWQVAQADSNISSLSALTLSQGQSTILPAFDPATTAYTASVGNEIDSLTVTPTATDDTATITVNTIPVASGDASGSIPLNVGDNTITVYVVSSDETTNTTYTVTVTRIQLATPVATAGTLVTDISFQANWDADSGATGYYLDVSTAADNFVPNLGSYDNLDVGNVTSLVVTGLTPDTAYVYRVRAYNSSGTSDNSDTQPVTTSAVPAPVATAATGNTTTDFTANWGSVPAATGYWLDVANDGGFTDILTNYNNLSVSGTSQDVTGLTAGAVYWYRVRATVSGQTSASSNTIPTAALPVAPASPFSSLENPTGFVANWTASNGATTYLLDISLYSDFHSYVSNYHDLDLGNVTAEGFTDLADNTQYYFRLRAVDAGGTSDYSLTVHTATSLPLPPATAPTANLPADITTGSFTASWTAVTGATHYILDVATDSGFGPGTILPGYNGLVVDGLSQSVTGLSANTSYYYQVWAANDGGAGPVSNPPMPVLTAHLNAPLASAATSITTTGFIAHWGAVTGATSYALDVSTENTFTTPGDFVTGYQAKDVGNVLLWAVTGLNPGVTYYYRVRAVDLGGPSASSATITVVTLPDPPAVDAASSISSTGFTANWEASTGATGYTLDVSTDPLFGFFVSIYHDLAVGNVTSAAVTGLNVSATYYYRLRAVDASGSSDYSDTITVDTSALSKPVVDAATGVTAGGFTTHWEPVAGATGYILDVATDNGFTSLVAGYNALAVSGTSQAVSGLAGGTVYYYRIQASNSGGFSDFSDTATQLTAPIAPVATAALGVTTSGFTAHWNPVTSATGYFLDVATDSGFTSLVAGYNNLPVSGTSQAVSGLKAGTTYYYRVRAANLGGASLSSNTITVKTAYNTVSLPYIHK